jgi:hypothetical protein
MPTNLRQLGVYGANLPTKKAKTVTASDFLIGGLIGQFERKFDKAFLCHNMTEVQEIFGLDTSSSFYGYEEANLFFQNIVGTSGKIYIKSHVGNTGSAIDAVVANATIAGSELADLIYGANLIKSLYNSHCADTAEHTTAADTVNTISDTDATDLASLITLISAILTKYAAHETDAALASSWAFHAAQETTTHALASTAAPTSLAECLTRLTDILTKFVAHDADDAAHGTHGTYATTYDPSESTTTTLIGNAAYCTESEYGVHGNRIGYKITNGARFTTATDGAPSSSNLYITVDSVSGVRVGDIIKCTHSGSAYIYKKITSIDETARRLYFASAFGSASFVDGDTVAVMGIRLQTFEKSINGIIKEVETDLGKVYCSMEPEVTDYYIDNVHATNKYIAWTDQGSTAVAIAQAYPDDVTSVTFLSGGADGTSATVLSQWVYHNETAFDDLPIRFIANCETTLSTVQASLEIYCQARWDNPKVIYNIAENQTKAQLQVIGSSFQRSDDVLGVICAQWIQITDPFTTSPIAPARSVPNVGAVMGAWVRTIGTHGIHFVPAVKDVAMNGIIGITGTQFTNDGDRTDLATYGINCLQYLDGYGYIIRNFFTPSTSLEFQFANGILMREYIKVSAVDSLQTSENTPNSMNRIKEDRMAILFFMRNLWNVGSTNTVPTGETFGIYETSDGTATKFEDHVEVIADVINNPISKIQAGERNLDVYFTYPAPAGSIKIGVGLMLLSQ